MLRAVGSRALSTATTAAPISSKAAKRSWSYMSEVLGNPGLAGRNFRIQAGELLKVIDLCAASSAMKHAGHAVCPTLSFDRVELLVPICHGDLVHMDARVVSVGNSTMVIQVLGRKKDVQTRQWVFTHEAFATFVSLGADRRPAAVPSLITESSEERQMQAHIRSRQALVNKFLADQAALDHEDIPSADAAEAASASTKFRDRVTMQESTLLLRKNFLPRHLNGIGTIFGGDLLEWMEGAALLCASNFTRNTNVVTIAMDRILFKTAIQVKPSTLTFVESTSQALRIARSARIADPYTAPPVSRWTTCLSSVRALATAAGTQCKSSVWSQPFCPTGAKGRRARAASPASFPTRAILPS